MPLPYLKSSSGLLLKEISPGCSLEGLMLKLKLQYFGHLMQKAASLEKTLILGKTEGRRRRDDRGWDGWLVSPTQWTLVWVDFGSWWCTGRHGTLLFMGSQRVRHDWVTEVNWIELAILWNSAFKWVYLSFSPLPFSSLLFTAICKSTSAFFYCQLF